MSEHTEKKIGLITDTVNHVEYQQLELKKILSNVKLEDFVERIEKLENKLDNFALKDQTDERIVEILKSVTKNTGNLNAIISDINHEKTRTEMRFTNTFEEIRTILEFIDAIKKNSGG